MHRTAAHPAKLELILHTQASCKESLYRTLWLMAHNRLHALANDLDPASPKEQWDAYLKEMESAENVASTRA